jgi:hypothetical protein
MLFGSKLIALFSAGMLAGLTAVPSLSLGASTQPAVRKLVVQAGRSSTKTSPRLVGAEARLQLLVTGELSDGQLRDLTRKVGYDVKPLGMVQISREGEVTPLHDGVVTVTASGEGTSASIELTVEQAENSLPINFANQIVPIFTKSGCNSGGCHGKSSGQNGFRLSLLGFEPTEDYEHLVNESRGRRLFPAAPQRSLLLTKGTALVPHGGGKRIETSSDDYKMLVRWIKQGMPYGRPTDPTLSGIEVLPANRTMARGAEQQLAVIALYSDGSTQDVTRSAVYETSDKEMATIDSAGHLVTMERPGTVSTMVRYQGNVGVFQATLPLGAPVGALPAANNFIDELVFKKLKEMGMPPSEMCDDGTFIRRVTLDIAGRLPTVQETGQFLADTNPAKRNQLIDRLIDSGDYADHFANFWASLLRNRRTNPTHARGNFLFHDWIRESLYQNKPYDRFVREIVTASGEVGQNPPVEWYRQVVTANTQLEDTTQLFLGTRIQCAQCHHHPYERWSQQDYYSLAAFFSQVTRKPSEAGEEVIYTRRAAPAATNIKTQQPAKPAGLGAVARDIAPEVDARGALVDWMVEPRNPFFAPALVNRYWKYFLNRGLVDPDDDMRATNPSTNPELLAALSRHFIESRFDLKDLVRTICRSRIYQLSGTPNAYNAPDRQNYSRYYPKRLTAEILSDAINALAQTSESYAGLPAGTRAVQLPDNSFNTSAYFLTVFGRPESSSACECERSQDASLAQSLHLLNSKNLLEKLSNQGGRAFTMAADTSRGDEEKIRELYLTAFSRKPAGDEMALTKSYLTRPTRDKDGKAKPADKREAFEDIVWAIVNSKEFLFNH